MPVRDARDFARRGFGNSGRARVAARQARREELEAPDEESKHLFRDYVAEAVNRAASEGVGRASAAARE